jgi:predicted negative regulator of RcsB-dependent stress response
MKRFKQTGFAGLELLLVVVVIVVVGLVGYKVYNRTGSKASQSGSSSVSDSQKASTSLGTVPEVNSKSDLDKAESALDQNDTTGANSSDDSQLSHQTNDY